MPEIEKIEVKSEPLTYSEYKIGIKLLDESKLVTYNLKSESCVVYKTENDNQTEQTSAADYWELQDGTTHVAIENLKSEQCEVITTHLNYESTPWSNNIDGHINEKTIIVEEIQIKDESCLKSFNTNLFACNICQYKTEVRSRFAKHLKIHTKEKSFVCSICHFKTTTEVYLKDHEKIHEGNRNYHKCSYCDYKSAKRSNTNRHMEICKMKPLKLDTSLNKNSLNYYVKINKRSEKQFKCDQCDYTSNYRCSLGNHKKIHLDRTLKCEQCDYKTLKQHEFSLHIMIHSDRQPYECEVCGYKAAFKVNLRRHVLKHAERKPFQCNHCSYNTYRKHHLTSHMLVHIRQPHKCRVCGYKTVFKKHLNEHVLIHAKLQP